MNKTRAARQLLMSERQYVDKLQHVVKVTNYFPANFF